MKYFLIFFIAIFFFSSAVTDACEEGFSYGVIDRQALKTELISANGNPKKKYTGQGGYLKIADTYFKSNMKKAFDKISSMLTTDIFQKLGWQQFKGKTTGFRKLQNQILDENRNLKEKYIGQETGYILFADTFYRGDMAKTFTNVSAVLPKAIFQKLGWQQFKGTTAEFRKLQNQILDKNGNLKKKYIGQSKGYLRLADTLYGGDMAKTFTNVSAVLPKAMFQKLGWQQFKGTTAEFRKLQNQILNESRNLKEKYIGQETGYTLFADTFYRGDMAKTFTNVSAVLPKAMFQKLGWKGFQGNTNQFHALIIYFRTHQFKDYKGTQGQRQVAALIFNKNPRRAYVNVSASREYLFINTDIFNSLRESGWSITLQ